MITDLTKVTDFYNKIKEEFDEFKLEFWKYAKVDQYEMADIILVCLAMAEHYNIDIQKALEEKTLFNEQRKD